LLLFIARNTLVMATLGATAFAAGRSILRRMSFSSLAEELAVSTGLGLGVLGTVLFPLALFGLLTRPAVVSVAVLAHIAALPTWRDTLTRLRPARLGGKRDLLSWIPVLLLLGLAAVLSLYPPTGFDATFYHLPYARALSRTHRLEFLPDLRFPIFPQLTELLFAALMLVAGDVSAQGLETLAFAAALLALAGWAGRRSKTAGLWAASAWAGCPAAALLAGAAYVDLSLTLFVLLAYIAWERWREDGSRAAIALSGAFAGCSAATKYHGLFVAVLLGIMTLWRGARRRELAGAGIFLAAFLAAASPWYVRNIAVTGNPVFPFLPRVFGASPYSLSVDAVTPGGTGGADASMTAARAAREWVGAPLRVARSLAGLPPGGQTPLSPAIAILAIIAAAAAFRHPRVRAPILFAAVYALACGGAEVRFLLPSAALSAGAGTIAFSERPGPDAIGSRAVRSAIALALAAPALLWTAHRIWRLGPVPVSEQERSAFLSRVLVAYPAVEYLNHTHGSSYTVYAVGAENLVYYAEGRLLGDWFGRYGYRQILGASAGDPVSLDRRLETIGAGYLLVNLRRSPFPPRENEEFRRRFRLLLRGEGFVLFERSSTFSSGSVR
jgi:hypothetical protein